MIVYPQLRSVASRYNQQRKFRPNVERDRPVQDAAQAFLDHQTAPASSRGLTLAQYRVICILAAGGMGEIYLAEDSRLRCKVALKMLAQPLTRSVASLQRLEQEAQLLSALNHANLLTVSDFCHAEGKYLLVTEFVEAETQRQIFNREYLDPARAIEIAVQVAASLSAVHLPVSLIAISSRKTLWRGLTDA